MQPEAEKITQNLQDANCPPELIEKFFNLEKQNDKNGQLKLLFLQRKNLLEALHKNQKQIDCLDYLIFNLEQILKGE